MNMFQATPLGRRSDGLLFAAIFYLDHCAFSILALRISNDFYCTHVHSRLVSDAKHRPSNSVTSFLQRQNGRAICQY